jgi:hypothetical protein
MTTPAVAVEPATFEAVLFSAGGDGGAVWPEWLMVGKASSFLCAEDSWGRREKTTHRPGGGREG